MANTDAPIGLRPVRYASGAPYNGAANKYYIPSTDTTNVFIGDPVRLAGSGDTLANYATVALTTPSTASTGKSIGVVVGFDPVEGVTTPNLNGSYRAASTAMYAWVADDPDLIFEAQEDSVGNNLSAADIGNNVNFTSATSGSTTFGLSGVEIDSSSKATTAKQLKLVGLVNRPGNDLGSNANWLVMFNSLAGHLAYSTTGV
jgi:hypothetical protein